jgi:hypothetical protein
MHEPVKGGRSSGSEYCCSAPITWSMCLLRNLSLALCLLKDVLVLVPFFFVFMATPILADFS